MPSSPLVPPFLSSYLISLRNFPRENCQAFVVPEEVIACRRRDGLENRKNRSHLKYLQLFL